MIYYTGLIIAISALRLISKNLGEKKSKTVFFIGTMLLLGLFQGLRAPTVGTDVPGYLGYFNFIANNGKEAPWEMGYVLFVCLLQYLGISFQGSLLVFAFIIQTPIIYTICKHSTKPLLSVFAYFAFGEFLFTFSGLRQAVAMSFTFASYGFIKEKKPIRYLIMILLACSFHKSALVNLLIYPLFYIRNKKNTLVFSLFVVTIVFAFKEQLVLLGGEIFGELYKTITKTGAYEMFFAFLILYIISGLVKFEKFDQEYMGLRNLLFAVVVVYSMASVSNYITRIGFSYQIFICLFIPKLMEKIRVKPTYMYDMTCIAICLAFFYMNIGFLDTLPYCFYFMK